MTILHAKKKMNFVELGSKFKFVEKLTIENISHSNIAVSTIITKHTTALSTEALHFKCVLKDSSFDSGC